MQNSSKVGNWCNLNLKDILESKRPRQWVRGTLNYACKDQVQLSGQYSVVPRFFWEA